MDRVGLVPVPIRGPQNPKKVQGIFPVLTLPLIHFPRISPDSDREFRWSRNCFSTSCKCLFTGNLCSISFRQLIANHLFHAVLVSSEHKRRICQHRCHRLLHISGISPIAFPPASNCVIFFFSGAAQPNSHPSSPNHDPVLLAQYPVALILNISKAIRSPR